MKIKNRIRLKSIIIFIIYFYIIISLGCFLFFNSPLYNEITLLITVGFSITLLIAFKLSSKYLFEQLVVIILSFLIFVFPRILMYLIAPDSVVFPFGSNINASTINNGLFYIFLGFIFFLIGMIIVNILFKISPLSFSIAPHDLIPYSNKNLLMLFFFVIAINFYFNIGLGISPYGKMRADNYNTLIQGIKVLFEVDSCFYFVFAVLLLKKKLFGKKRKGIIIIIVLLSYITFSVISGGRSGVLRVIISLLVISTILYGNLQLNIRKLTNIFLLLIVLSFIFYPVATFYRIKIQGSYQEFADPAKYAAESTGDIFNVEGLIINVFNRLGIVDYPILIVTQEGDKTAESKYHDIQYPLKNIINNLLPGVPFPESEIMTSRTIDIIYRGSKEMGFLERYNSEYWTIWGILYVYYGWFGGILAMLCMGFICHLLYMSIIMFSSGLYRFFLRLWFFLYAINCIIWNMGIDFAFTILFFSILQFTFLSFCFYLFKYIRLPYYRYATQLVEIKHR